MTELDQRKLSFDELQAKTCGVEFRPGITCLRSSATEHEHIGWNNDALVFEKDEAAA